MDILADILASLRLSGGIVFDAQTRGEWRLLSRFQPEDCAPFFPTPERIISYHYIRRGRMFAQLPGQPAVELREGSMVLFPRNDPHYLFTGADCPPVDIARFVGPRVGSAPNTIRMNFKGDPADCYCGWLGVTSGDHPLLGALPPMMVIGPDAFAADWIVSSLRIAADDWNASPALVAKISELFFAQAVRRHVQGLEGRDGGWLAGLRDPAVARALRVIHSRYAEELEIDGLAREAGVSQTVLRDRFVRLLGEPPMRYCAQWRRRQRR